jgi:hypothetical protein
MPLQLQHHVCHDLSGSSVDRVEWLIEQEQVCFLDQRTGQQDTLLLTTGEVTDALRGQSAETESIEHTHDQGCVPMPWPAQPAQAHIAPGAYQAGDTDRKAPIDLAALGKIRHEVRTSPGRMAVDSDAACLAREQASHSFEQGRFP